MRLFATLFAMVASALLVITSGSAGAAPVYSLRLFNTDDQFNAYINGSATPVLTNSFLHDTGFVDISSALASGTNTITFQLMNIGGGYTYGYQLSRDGSIIDQGTCGTVDVAGCGNDSATGIVFGHSITFGLSSADTPASLRLFNTDDQLQASISNSGFSSQVFLSNGFRQDTGQVDLASYLRAGENRIDLALTNDLGGYTYGFEFKNAAGSTVDAGQCGTANVVGCNDNNGAIGTVFTHTLIFSVPEPGTIALFAIAVAGLGFSRRRRVANVT